MEIKGKITRVTRNEVTKDKEVVIYVTAGVAMEDKDGARVSDFSIYGYEPEFAPAIGQKVSVTLTKPDGVA